MASGLVAKKEVRGVDEYINNGKKRSRNGTYTYFSFNSEYLASLLDRGVDSKIRPSDVGVDPSIRQGAVSKRGRGGPKHPDEDSSTIDYSTKDHSISGTPELILSVGGWSYYSDETATFEDDPKIYNWRTMTRVLPPEIMQIIAERDMEAAKSRRNRIGE